MISTQIIVLVKPDIEIFYWLFLLWVGGGGKKRCGEKGKRDGDKKRIYVVSKEWEGKRREYVWFHMTSDSWCNFLTNINLISSLLCLECGVLMADEIGGSEVLEDRNLVLSLRIIVSVLQK